MTDEIKYVLCPGWITSKTDGDRHYIGAVQLANLYGVKLSECIIYSDELLKIYQNLPKLYPKYDGNYDLLTEEMDYRTSDCCAICKNFQNNMRYGQEDECKLNPNLEITSNGVCRKFKNVYSRD